MAKHAVDDCPRRTIKFRLEGYEGCDSLDQWEGSQKMKYIAILVAVFLISCGPRCYRLQDSTGEGRTASDLQQDAQACNVQKSQNLDVEHHLRERNDWEAASEEQGWEDCMLDRGWVKETTNCRSS